MRTWIERVSAGPKPPPGFAGKAGNNLDRFKEMIRDGWELELLIAPGGQEIVALGWRVD